MHATILVTKLYIPPPRSKIVLRPRLIERLNEGLLASRKLIFISAPAGFGKTTLISEWAAESVQPVAWLSLDEGDNDPICFLTYLTAALQMITPNIGSRLLGMIQSPQSSSVETIMTALINEIAAIPNPFILVLDDYHLIDAKPVDDALTFLIEHLPQQMRLVIATREDPQLPLARLRARSQLTELRATDLRFTPAESTEFLNQVMGLNISAEAIAALEARTEGWITGLQLAALSMQGQTDIAGFIQSFTGSHRFVLDYLVEEVLQHQPENVRNFLLETAMLDRLSGQLCDAVTGQDNGREMLEALDRENLFVIPLDDQRHWYRYHRLFAEVLQAHLREAQPDRLSTLHRRASEWYKQNGLPSDAIRHALASKDFEGAASLIELAWSATEDGFLATKYLGWAKALPDELIRTRPVLSVWYACALLNSGEMEAAEVRLTDAERWLEPAGNMVERPENPAAEHGPEQSRKMVFSDEKQFRSLSATIAIARAYCAQALGDVPGTIKFARRALDLTQDADPLSRGQANGLLGLAYWSSGDLEAANLTFSGYTIMLRTAGSIRDAISATVVLAEIRLALGRLQEAIRTIEQLLKFVMDQGEPILLDTADLHRGLCELYLEQGDLETAEQHLQRSKELGEKAELPIWRYRWCVAQARIHATQGDLDGALECLDQAERLYFRSPLPDVRPISALKARIWISQGRLVEAQEWAREQGIFIDETPRYLLEFQHVTLARLLIARFISDRGSGILLELLGLLKRLLQAAEAGGRIGSMLEILVLQALAHQAQGNIVSALASLERALNLAEPEGFIRIFVNEGKSMAELVEKFEATDRSIRLRNYVLRLLSAFDRHAADHSYDRTPVEKNRHSLPEKQAVSPEALFELLSDREQEVLALLRTDLSGPEIAIQLVVSLNTFRTHTKSIYSKLGVNNRRAAIRQAEKLDLL